MFTSPQTPSPCRAVGDERQMPAAEEQRDDERRAGDHRRVFAEEEERELHRRIFGMVAADQFLSRLPEDRTAARFVSANIEMVKTTNEIEERNPERALPASSSLPSVNGSSSQPFSTWYSTISDEVQVADDQEERDRPRAPARARRRSSAKLERMPPRNGYFEFDDQPASTMP